MIRFLALLCLAAPAQAWEFRATPLCTLSHMAEAGQVVVTYDHATQDYAIAVTTPGGWPPSDAFSIRFDGPAGRVISTARHRVDGQTLTVTDRGFGNVLDGLEFNDSATAFTATAALQVSLDGAAAPVQAFRACTAALSS